MNSFIDLRNLKIESRDDLLKYCNTFRNPSFENFRIIYMKDNNNNVANYDFKYVNKIFDNNESKNNYINATNIKLSGICCNNIISGNNIEIKVPISNLVGELNDIIIDEDELGILNSNIQKVIIFIDNKYYIDYLDLETLTHQFYEIKNSLYITQ